MDFPFLNLVLLALPVAVAVLIVAVSVGRRRRGTRAGGQDVQPVHRLQAGSAAAQDAAVHPVAAAPKATSARTRRAASAARQHNR